MLTTKFGQISEAKIAMLGVFAGELSVLCLLFILMFCVQPGFLQSIYCFFTIWVPKNDCPKVCSTN